jgi:glycosyltransferase involved in cell wall biosynthesis
LLKIVIIGTKGIPNSYGGFEAFAQHISQRLAESGFDVSVFQPHHSKEILNPINGVSRVPVKEFRFIPKNIGRIVYNFKSLSLAYRQKPDAVICCGHSPALFFPLFPKSFRKRIIVNMDGLEWRRPKWGFLAKSLLKFTECMAIHFTTHVVADSKSIQHYISKKYKKQSTYIAYGSERPTHGVSESTLAQFGVKSKSFGLLIARIEPENRIEQAIKAFSLLGKSLVIVGSTETAYAKKLLKKYSLNQHITFVGAIYNTELLGALRIFCRVYFHGHSVGGTNPSLLDAMAAGCTIIAHNNPYNGETLGNGGLYYSDLESLNKAIQRLWDGNPLTLERMTNMNKNRVAKQYSWYAVTNKYVELIKTIANA